MPDDAAAESATVAEGTGAERSAAELLSNLAAETSALVRQELALFRAELRRIFGRAGQGAAALAVGAFLAFGGWLALLAAAVLGLATAIPAWLAALGVAVANLAAGAALCWFGRRRLAVRSLRPRRTLANLREDAAWFRERLR
jgi:hypothetical protein